MSNADFYDKVGAISSIGREYIAFFDSGVGGLTVLDKARRLMPKEKFLFFADRDNAPYGTKEPKVVRRHIINSVEFLRKTHSLKALVLACNTATSVAVEELRSRYAMPIIGMEPAVKLAIDMAEEKYPSGNKRVLVIATNITIRGERMKKLLTKYDSYNMVDLLALPELVTFAEDGVFNAPEVRNYLIGELAAYDLSKYAGIVLGCTHFYYFKDVLRDILPLSIDIIEGNLGTVAELSRRISSPLAYDNKELASCTFYYSGRLLSKFELLELKALSARIKEMEAIGHAHSD